MNAEFPPLLVPPREIPAPRSISSGARAALMGRIYPPVDYPPLDDHEAWIQRRKAGEEAMVAMALPQLQDLPVDVDERTIGSCHLYVCTPRGAPSSNVYMDIHGGALVSGGGEMARAIGMKNCALIGQTVWAIDYRMPPEYPYPFGLDDCLVAYRSLLENYRPGQIAIGGASAGANLAAAAVLRARDEGLPLPAAVLLLSPEVDLTESGDTFQTNLGVDTILQKSLMPANLLYANGHDLADPYLSPLFGDFERGFCPTYLTSGTRDLFLSNAVRMHRALRQAQVDAELHVFEAAPHGLALGVDTPEEQDFNREMLSFLSKHWQ